MDIGTHLRRFEASFSNYFGDDPLDPWDRFVEFLESRLPAEEKSNLSIVLDRLVENFMQEERYYNDPRYVNHCIRRASYYSEPIKLYSDVHSRGIGTRAAALYVAWAQQFEMKGLLPQAEAVYQRAIENQAEPADTVLQQYRLFQSRHSKTQPGPTGRGRTPLQNSQLLNRNHQQEPDFSQLPADKTVCIISRSENNPSSRPGKGSTERVYFASMYCKEDLVCEGSELSFEELRARRFFARRKEQEENRKGEAELSRVLEEEEGDGNLKFQPVQPLSSQQLSIVQPAQERGTNWPVTSWQASTIHPAQDRGTDWPMASPMTKTVQPAQEGGNNRAEAFQQGQSRPASEREGDPGSLTMSSRHAPTVGAFPPSQRGLQGLRLSCGLSARKDLTLGLGRKSDSHLLHGGRENPARSASDESYLPPPSSSRPSLAQPANPQPALPSPNPNPTGSLNSGPSLADPDWPSAAAAPSSALCIQAPQTSTQMLQSKGHLEKAEPGQDQSLEAVKPNALERASCSQLKSPAVEFCSRDLQGDATERDVAEEDDADVSRGGQSNHSHVTPNTSLGLTQATPSRILPSPTVNTREALDVIMDMFQAPTFLQESLFNTTAQHPEASFKASSHITVLGKAQPSSFIQPRSAAPFGIFQDEDEQENGRVAPAVDRANAVRALAEIPVSKPQDSPVDMETMPDESALWGARNASVAPCPNHTRDFAMDANLVSTPFHPSAPHPWSFEPDHDNTESREFGSEQNPFARQLKKLSPIIEQNSPEETESEEASCTRRGQGGTIVGEGLSLVQQTLTQNHTTGTVCGHPLAALSFPDHTASQGGEESLPCPPSGSKPCWNIYSSPQPPLTASPLAEPDPDSLLPKKSFCRSRMSGNLSAFHADVCMSPEAKSAEAKPVLDIPMSPDAPGVLDWLRVGSPAPGTQPDLDVFTKSRNVPVGLALKVQSSPARLKPEVMDVPMSPEPPTFSDRDPTVAMTLVSDPWDEQLIGSLLASLQTPLSSYPNYTTWDCALPNITPKMSVQMAGETLRVDFVLGQGAFATVYQATNLTTTQKLILKVQKPANPWEFYINCQLNLRLHPSVRHIYNNIYSAHLFKNGSVLLGELHNCGTLLNVINLYKSRSEKVMPQPLVLYFTVCILHMVEQLHQASVIHADIKPDNFLLGERFLENECFDEENLQHGLALIDLGQSIDMTLFPEGTAFTAKCMTSGFQCTEMLSGKPWNYQTDYFGIAGTVYCMIFGTYMQVKNENGVWKTNCAFKRNPHGELWLAFFHTLLNVRDCSSLPCLRALRLQLRSVLRQHYTHKLLGLKNRLVVQLLEARPNRR